jgi:hypothetical protein
MFIYSTLEPTMYQRKQTTTVFLYTTYVQNIVGLGSLWYILYS